MIFCFCLAHTTHTHTQTHAETWYQRGRRVLVPPACSVHWHMLVCWPSVCPPKIRCCSCLLFQWFKRWPSLFCCDHRAIVCRGHRIHRLRPLSTTPVTTRHSMRPIPVICLTNNNINCKDSAISCATCRSCSNTLRLYFSSTSSSISSTWDWWVICSIMSGPTITPN